MDDNQCVLSNGDVYHWVDDLVGRFRVFGPILQKRNQTAFEPIQNSGQLNLDYCSMMHSPRSFIYPSVQKLLEIDRKTNMYKVVDPGPERTQLIFAIHPCDMHAINVLDRTFLGVFQDYYYSKLRQGTVTLVLNCHRACVKGFCPSMGTGPFLRLQEGYDVVMTSLGDGFLVEAGSQRGRELIEAAPGIGPAMAAGGPWPAPIPARWPTGSRGWGSRLTTCTEDSRNSGNRPKDGKPGR